MKTKSGLIVLLLFVSAVLPACSRNENAIQIKGSDTMVNLAQAWVEEYMADHPDASIAVTGGGSGAGIAALISGTTDIALASRDIHPKEIDMARKRGIEPLDLHVATDGVAVVVHPGNPASKLTVKQLSDIYTGKVKTWEELGLKGGKIVALSRERNSGTHIFFLEEIVKLGKTEKQNEFDPTVLMMPSSQAIVEEVMANRSAIGYIGLGYMNDRMKAVAVSKGPGLPYVMPDDLSVKTKRYPISRSLHFYLNKASGHKTGPFVEFVMSRKGQEIVQKMDFVPVKLR